MQDDPLFPVLFTSLLQELFRELYWEEKDVKIVERMLIKCRFDDDVILIIKNPKEVQNSKYNA